MSDKTKLHNFYKFINIYFKDNRGNISVVDDIAYWSFEFDKEIPDDIKKAIEDNDISSIININNNTLISNFSINSYFFKDKEHFRIKLMTLPKIDYFYVFEENIFYSSENNLSNTNNTEIKNIFSRFTSIKKILSILAENAHHYDKSNNFMIYIDVSSSKQNDNVELISKINHLKKYTDLLDKDINLNFLSKFDKDENNCSEAYCVREKTILRTTIIDFISIKSDSDNQYNETNASEATYKLLKNFDGFCEKFEANLQIYLKDISIDKLKSEISEGQIKIMENINKSLHEATNKLMFLPGVGIIITIARQINTNPDNLQLWKNVIPFIMYSLVIIITITVFSQKKIIDSLETTFVNSKIKLDGLPEQSKETIQTLIDKTKDFITFSKSVVYVYIFVLLFIPTLILYYFNFLSTKFFWLLLLLPAFLLLIKFIHAKIHKTNHNS